LLFAAPVAVAQTDAASQGSRVSAEIQQLKKLILDQQRQIDELRRMVEQKYAGNPAAPPAPNPAPGFRKLGEVGSTVSIIPPGIPEAAAPALRAVPVPQKTEAGTAAPSPLSLRIGETSLTPVGFMDFTGVYRDTAPGSGIVTNFGNFPYRVQSAVNGNLSEMRLSPQNSRIGMRFDTRVRGTKVVAYWESDFLGAVGNPPVGNVAVTTDSYPLRLRLFWVDLSRNKWEVLGGQTWSLMTPNRSGISPLPGDVFYSQVVDPNYTLGLPCCRIPELRFVYHPNKAVSMAFAFANPEQYMGGSSGGSAIALPSALATPYGSQLSNGTLTLNTPNLHPDLIAKIAFDGHVASNHAVHFEVAGLERTFKTYLPATGAHFTKAGAAVSANLNFELFKGLSLLTNNYYSDGGGRYLFGQAPDLVVSPDGHLSLVHSMSTTSGFEFTRRNTLLYTYYGGVYIGRNVVIDANGSRVGYGYTGASNSQNRSIQEATFGVNQTLWKDPKYGAINLMGQYAYFSRNPWFVSAGTPTHAYMNEIWLNLRYTLPGSAPASK
jgi:hypothetical protein